MIKHILIALVLVVALSGLCNATVNFNYNTDGIGTFSTTDRRLEYAVPIDGVTCYYKYIVISNSITGGAIKPQAYTSTSSYSWYGSVLYPGFAPRQHEDDLFATNTHTMIVEHYFFAGTTGFDGKEILIVDTTPFTNYNITGSTACVDSIKLYIGAISEDNIINSADLNHGGDTYSYEVLNNYTYNLVFYPDLHVYQFTVDDNDIVYDYDDCTHTQYRFEESCGNLIPDSEGFYLEWNPLGWWNMETYFEESGGILDILESSATKMSIYTNTFIGSTGWLIDPVAPNNTYTLENPNIAWGLKVIVQNESTGELIDGAMVRVNQSCYCTSGTSVRQKKTVQGMVTFGDMSLQDASLFVMKGGYKILVENTTGYSVFLSGRANFSSKTWIVKLANSNSTNSSSFHEVNNTASLYFKDVNNNITSKILDTDANVYLHYNNNNSNNEPMTLKFQSSSTHSYFMDEQSWNIPHGEIGYKTIANSYFTPWDYSYRAVMYNNSVYGWNITIPLTVRNGTRETEQHYQNLTTNLWFMYTNNHKIDFRDDMKIVAHACSNNITLMNVDVELWKDGVYTACKNLTATDFTNADVPYYYVWTPTFDYISGSNYSVRMYGFDRTLLETDYVDCITDNTTRKNKLTIIVKDYWGNNIDNTVVYLEGYGSIPTGVNYYASFEGLDNGYYRFKATKDGYAWAGWNNTTLSDADQTITYTLTETTSENLYTVTINVFNVTGTPLTNCNVYLTGKDAINTGINNYGVFYNVTEGTHTYKAGKSGYSTSTLTDILVDSNKNININLNISTPPIVNYTSERLTDAEVQDIYLPIMYLIFICILCGAFLAIAGGKF